MVVYKYSLSRTLAGQLRAAHEIPHAATFLSLHVQNDVPCVWFLVDPDEERVQLHTFQVVGTGHNFDRLNAGVFRGTVLLEGGALVLHVFDSVSP